MSMTTEQRETLNQRRQEATRELVELTCAGGFEAGFDKTERRKLSPKNSLAGSRPFCAPYPTHHASRSRDRRCLAPSPPFSLAI
jgi:hypothetical protein